MRYMTATDIVRRYMPSNNASTTWQNMELVAAEGGALKEFAMELKERGVPTIVVYVNEKANHIYSGVNQVIAALKHDPNTVIAVEDHSVLYAPHNASRSAIFSLFIILAPFALLSIEFPLAAPFSLAGIIALGMFARRKSRE